jgi:hypothetical protein
LKEGKEKYRKKESRRTLREKERKENGIIERMALKI